MSAIIPNAFKLHQSIYIEDSIEREELMQIPPTISVTEYNLSSRCLTFNMNYDNIWIGSADTTGFLVRVAFKTKLNNTDNKAALTTLSSNFFPYMFQKAVLRIGQNATIVEEFSNPGLITDIFHTMSNRHTNEKAGVNYGYIRDENTGEAILESMVVKTIPAAAGADLATFAPKLKDLEFTTAMKNSGFVRRMKMYNYDVTNETDFREVTIFYPLNKLFNFFKDITIAFRCMNVSIDLTRELESNFHNAYFGAANTTMDLQLKDILLCFNRLTLTPSVQNFISNQVKSTARYPYLRKWSSIVHIGNEKNYSRSFNFSRASTGIPRFILVILRPNKTYSAEVNYQLHDHGKVKNIKI